MDKSSALSFEGQAFYFGIDVHKKQWTITVRSENMELKKFVAPPDAVKLREFANHHYPGGVYYSVYEAGFCGFSVHRALTAVGFHNIVVHPPDIPHTDQEKRRKNDAQDSRKLARELASGSLKPLFVPSPEEEALRALCRERAAFVRDAVRTKNRIKAILRLMGVPIDSAERQWSGVFIKFLEEQCRDCLAGDGLRFHLEALKSQRARVLSASRNLRRRIRENAKAAKVVRLLRSVPGVGFLAAVTLYTEIIDIKRFSNLNKLNSFVGLLPTEHSSDEKQSSGGMTKRRNAWTRHVVIEAAWVAARKDPAMLKAFANSSKRMKKNMAIVKVAKKLLSRIGYVWKNETAYQYSKIGG